MGSDSNPFELVDEGDDDAPAPKPKPKPETKPAAKPEPEPAGGDLPPLELEPELEVVADPGPEPTSPGRAAAASSAEVEEIELEDEPPPPPPPVDDAPSDGSTVRMSLADVVSAWDEEAPEGLAAAAAAGKDAPAKDRSGMKRVAIMVLVIVAVLALIIVLFASCAHTARAEELPDPSTIGVDFDGLEGTSPQQLTRRSRRPGCCWRDWEVHITPYGFLANVTGDVYADGDKTKIDIPFEDILDRTAAGGMLNVAVGWKRWVLEMDGLYGHLQDAFDVGRTTTDVDIKQYQLDVALGYVLIGRPYGRWTGRSCCPPPAPRCARLIAYAGARYNQTDVRVRVQRPAGAVLPAIDRTATSSESSWKPFVGLGWRKPLSRSLTLRMRGDVGTGEAGGQTKTDVRLEATLAWRFRPRWNLAFGYRLMNQESVKTTGGVKEGSDLLQHGPLIGIGFSF